jgi:hypothetical protein
VLPPSHQKGERVSLGEKLDLLVDVFAPSAPTHIFNTPEFFRLHAKGGALGHYFQLVDSKSDTVLATLHFTEISPGFYRSPARGTFGGISCNHDPSLEQLEAFVRAIEHFLVARGGKKFQVLLAPASHNLSLFSTSVSLLSRQGYEVRRQDLNDELIVDLNYDLLVDVAPLSEHMDYGNRKRLNKCLREGFVSARLGKDRYAEAYEVIAQNRRRKNFPVSMDFSSIMTLVDMFDEDISFFGIDRADELVAAAICVAVSHEVLYVFLWGDAEDTQDYSPVVPLAATIYAHCQSKGFRIMDAGTSTVDGKPNHGVVRFKRKLGMRESLKLTMNKGTAGDA